VSAETAPVPRRDNYPIDLQRANPPRFNTGGSMVKDNYAADRAAADR